MVIQGIKTLTLATRHPLSECQMHSGPIFLPSALSCAPQMHLQQRHTPEHTLPDLSDHVPPIALAN